MQFFRQEQVEISAILGWRIRVLVLTAPDPAEESKVAVRIAELGGAVDVEYEAFSALDTLIMDRTGYGLFVIECDAVGGLLVGRNLVSLLHKGGGSLPILLIASDCTEGEFPVDSQLPVVLRAPASPMSLRMGFEHAMRNRLVC